MTTGGGDRLSDISDDLLRRILYFVPFKDAASTSLLSRRWGSLWRLSGAVNLAVQVHDHRKDRRLGNQEALDAFFSDQEAFVRTAKAALDATEAAITRLTLSVESDDGDGNAVSHFLCHSRVFPWGTDADVVGDILSHPAARRVEELHVAAVAAAPSFYNYLVYAGKENHEQTGIYRLFSLPSSEHLRVLDLTNCGLLMSSSSLVLPRLATLRLRFCSVSDESLQAILDAAPELTTVQLESLLFFQLETPFFYDDPELDDTAEAEPRPPVLRLRFHAATTLVLALCGMPVQAGSGVHHGKRSWAIEIDAPWLQSFTYKGLMRRFSLRSAAAPAGVARVDLHFLRDDNGDPDDSSDFWQFLNNFANNARTLRLKVENELKDIAAIGKGRRARLLCVFPRVERLELEGVHRSKSKTAAVAIANLLHCCPVLGEIMLKLSTVPLLRYKDSQSGFVFLERKDRLDYNKSIDRFVRCHQKSKTATAISMGDISIFCDNFSYDGVRGIPGLSGRSFACLQRTLTRVGLQFRLDNKSISSCLGVRLIKFFAGHASVLEEICVDTGNRRLYEHLNFNAVTQVALAPSIPISATASIQHKNLVESSPEFSIIPGAFVDSTTELAKSTVGFTVLALRRQEKMDCKS